MIGGEFLTTEEKKFIKWYDYLWFIIPIAGIAIFVGSVSTRAKNANNS